MERQFHNEDFERLLRDNANQYRMYPSEKVWKGVYTALHNRRRWYRLSAFFLLLITTSIATVTLLQRNTEQALVTGLNPATSAINTLLENNRRILSTTNSNTTRDASSPETYKEEHVALNRAPVFNLVSDKTPVLSVTRNSAEYRIGEIYISPSALNEQLNNNTLRGVIDLNIPGNENLTAPITVGDITAESIQTPEDGVANQSKTPEKIEQEILALTSQNAPIQVKGKTAKLTAQVYFTPTVSYRKLSENKAYSRAASTQNPGYNYTQYVDVNTVVDHKPAMGLELGIEGRYAITDRIAVKVGAQFNINRYDIRAYFHPTEFATIALNSGSGPDSVISLSNYRNFNGATANWLENFYFTASIPIGAEIIVFDNKKIQWGISGSVQPSYVIGDRAYLISKDYKNYAKVPNLMRRWNISTDFETFISYSTGRLRWQVGPQVRYQHLSSFVNEYPVKENLFDIGLKIGASLNKR